MVLCLGIFGCFALNFCSVLNGIVLDFLFSPRVLILVRLCGLNMIRVGLNMTLKFTSSGLSYFANLEIREPKSGIPSHAGHVPSVHRTAQAVQWKLFLVATLRLGSRCTAAQNVFPSLCRDTCHVPPSPRPAPHLFPVVLGSVLSLSKHM